MGVVFQVKSSMTLSYEALQGVWLLLEDIHSDSKQRILHPLIRTDIQNNMLQQFNEFNILVG